jgi:general secretion pathway protein J
MTRGANGFTLLELLVSLSIFAMISVLLFGGFRFGLRVWESGNDRIEQSSQIELVQNLLRRQLAVATLPRTERRRDVIERAPPLFTGKQDSVRFVASLPIRAELGSYYQLRLETQETDRRGVALVLNWSPFSGKVRRGEEPDGNETDLLLDNVAGVEFAYFGVYDRERPADWVSEWSNALTLPQLVRMRVTFPPGDLRRWPDLVVAPKLSRRR